MYKRKYPLAGRPPASASAGARYVGQRLTVTLIQNNMCRIFPCVIQFFSLPSKLTFLPRNAMLARYMS